GGGQHVEGMAQRLADALQPIEGLDGGQDMGRVGALAAFGCEGSLARNSVNIVSNRSSSAWPAIRRWRNSLSSEASKPGPRRISSQSAPGPRPPPARPRALYH